jgi:hypothetical protein
MLVTAALAVAAGFFSGLGIAALTGCLVLGFFSGAIIALGTKFI